MKHARSDYSRIQDPAFKIPADEPVFLLRGQDKIAPAVVKMWADIAELAGVDGWMVAAAREQAREMEIWQMAYPAKLPDMSDGER